MKISSSSLLVMLLAVVVVNASDSPYIFIGASSNPAPVTPQSVQKVSDLAAEMYSRWEALDQACDFRAVFAVAYLYMTASAKNLVQDLYFDVGNKMADFIPSTLKAPSIYCPTKMNKKNKTNIHSFSLDFAARYIAAYDAWEAGNLNAVTGPWLVTFNFGATNKR